MFGALAMRGGLTLLFAAAMVFMSNPASSEPRLLNATDIRNILVGNSVRGYDEDDDLYMEFFAADGVIHGLTEDGEGYRGWWRLSRNLLCLRFPPDSADDDDEDAASTSIVDSVDCYYVTLDGSRIYFVPARNQQDYFYADLIQGNPGRR